MRGEGETEGTIGGMIHGLDRPGSDWLDLSTAVNPYGWDAPTPPPSCWFRMPESDDGLLAAAGDYYGTDSLLATPGCNAALALLPYLRARSRVAVVDPGYFDHAAAWRRAGHEVVPVSSAQLAAGAAISFDVLVVVNPNHRDGSRFEPEALLAWRRALAARGGWLVVDEAFVDPAPEISLAGYSPLPGLVILRSIGTFFGLAGIRVGFALGPDDLLGRLADAFGPCAVNGPGRWVARQALMDRPWQQRMRARLQRESTRLHALLGQQFARRIVGTPLFGTVLTPDAARIHERLAREAILVRLLERQDGLRFGLPPDEAGWSRLAAALQRVVRDHAGA